MLTLHTISYRVLLIFLHQQNIIKGVVNVNLAHNIMQGVVNNNIYIIYYNNIIGLNAKKPELTGC